MKVRLRVCSRNACSFVQPGHKSAVIISAFNELNVKSSTYKYELMARFKTSKWAIRDRGKFGLLISDVRSLVDSLMVELIGQRSRLKDCG
ncbi:unnamed protein product [Fusarium graminearum]|nr:unnamed protein product [Fusarium graminearum]CAG2001564.1 unnamed protein product [Fusarium graminearum]VTO91955.1 unnamed protein product [Fusarium graminearum]